MEVELRLFAVLRERAGRERMALELPAGATVADALAAAAREPGLGEILAAMPVRAALNREYVDDDTPVAAGDELALIPPVSGGAATGVHARVTAEPLSVDALAAGVGRPGAGATVVFCGTTRKVERLEYEAYAEMAAERIERILADCVAGHGLEAAAAEHRTGSVPLGEPSVVVAVSAAHRGEAFAGAHEAIDRIKAEAPIWKQEVDGGDDGESRRWAEGSAASAGPGAEIAGPGGPTPDARRGRSTRLTHLDDAGSARMVDVGDKPETARRARAEARLAMSPETAAAVAAGDAPKGDVLGAARLAGIGAAKRTWELIPLAHPLALDFIDVDGSVDAGAGLVTISAQAGTTARTGVEMEAMTACAVAALTVYDMVKGLERGVAIEALELVHKSGGRSGQWRRER
jgi:molybdenum cofactor biosynthesis protein MoaC/molybdopterin converting factor subunit 1